MTIVAMPVQGYSCDHVDNKPQGTHAIQLEGEELRV